MVIINNQEVGAILVIAQSAACRAPHEKIKDCHFET